MKLTKNKLKEIIREEIQKLNEGSYDKKIGKYEVRWHDEYGRYVDVWDHNQESKSGDKKTLAQISKNTGKIRWFDKKLPSNVKKFITKLADDWT